MLSKRIIPTLLLKNETLVKTVNFNKFKYIGDPCNTVKIFNELEVDEIIIQDIDASLKREKPNLKIIKNIASECFMPLVYGGGINCLDHAKSLFDVGVEKISINTAIIKNPSLISEISNKYGSQALIASIDVKKSFFSKKRKVYSKIHNINKDPISWAKEIESLGAGEILITSVDNEGTWLGFDLHFIADLSKELKIPIIANGGAGSTEHIREVFKCTEVSAVGVGSMVVFQKKGMGVLVNFPIVNEEIQ